MNISSSFFRSGLLKQQLQLLNGTPSSASFMGIFTRGAKKEPTEPPKKPPAMIYNFFYSKRYPELKAKFPGKTVPEIMGQIGTEWKSMTDLKKLELKKLHEKETEKFQKYFEKLSASEQESLTKPVKERVKRDPLDKKEKQLKKELAELEKSLGKPLTPLSAYLLFCQQRRETDPSWKGKPVTDFSKVLAAAWKNLPEKEKKEFNDKSNIIKGEHKIELEAWNKKSEHNAQLKEIQEKLDSLSKERKMKQVTEKLKDLMDSLDKPKKPGNALILFKSGLEQSMSDKEKISAWKELQEAEKKRFQEQAGTLMAEYDKEMRDWSERVKASGELAKVNKLQKQLREMQM